MTTQQSGYIGPRDAERSQALVKFLAKVAFRGEPLFRSSRPDSIETHRPDGDRQRPGVIVPVF